MKKTKWIIASLLSVGLLFYSCGNNIPEETESVTENGQVSDSYVAPQGVSERITQSTTETTNDMSVTMIS